MCLWCEQKFLSDIYAKLLYENNHGCTERGNRDGQLPHATGARNLWLLTWISLFAYEKFLLPLLQTIRDCPRVGQSTNFFLPLGLEDLIF